MTSNGEPNFSRMQIEEVENGWIVEVGSGMGYVGRRYVFSTLSGLAQWLIEIEAARAVKEAT